jgi:hypothetical protein
MISASSLTTVVGHPSPDIEQWGRKTSGRRSHDGENEVRGPNAALDDRQRSPFYVERPSPFLVGKRLDGLDRRVG